MGSSSRICAASALMLVTLHLEEDRPPSEPPFKVLLPATADPLPITVGEPLLRLKQLLSKILADDVKEEGFA